MSEPAYPDALPAQYRMHWYTVERVLGQGGFGITYLARDTNLDQLVAVKEYLPVEVASRLDDRTVRSRSDGQRDRYRWGLERFIQEARTLARFDHPNIVRVHSVFEFNGTAYMVMRFEEGDNLGALLDRRGTFPEKELLRILLPILDGLELVHSAGFIHRDIKPDNIHIRADGSPVLLDFGSARHSLGKARTLTILVAPGYAPFEQYYSSSENQGPWTDIYSLGATCYRAIAGTPPIDAISRSKGILGSTSEVLVPAATVGNGRYSGRLLAAVDHALAFAEKDRPQTVAQWRRELLGELAGVSLAPHAPAAPAPAPQAAVPGIPASAATAPVASGVGARAPIVWATVGAVAGAIAIAVFLRVSGPENRNLQPAPAGKAPAALNGDTQIPIDETERQRQAKIAAEKKKLEEEAERQRQAKNAAEKRTLEEEAERQRQARFAADKKKLEEEAERQRQAKIAAEKKLEEEAERQRQAKIAAEKKKLEEEAERQRQAKIAAEKKKLEEEAERQRRNVDAVKRQLDSAASAESRGDFEQARRILQPLAYGGNATAQMRLGAIYEEGRGGARNAQQAYFWYSLAMQCGEVSAGAGKARVLIRLQQAERNQADDMLAGLSLCRRGAPSAAAR